MDKPTLLDLFSGTHSVGNVAKELGYNVTSLDLTNADICCNILDWAVWKSIFFIIFYKRGVMEMGCDGIYRIVMVSLWCSAFYGN